MGDIEMKKGILLVVILLVILSFSVSAGVFDFLTGKQVQDVESSIRITASPSEINIGEIVSITVEASDPNRITHVLIWDSTTNTWDYHECEGLSNICSYTWEHKLDEIRGYIFRGNAINGDGEYLGSAQSNIVKVVGELMGKVTSQSICGDGVCENFEKQITCFGEYTFDDGQKHEICWANSQNCPIDCGRNLGNYVGEKLEAPICGDGECEGVESKNICKITPGLKREHCQPACLSDCSIISLNARKDFSLPIEITNKEKGPFGFASSGEYVVNGRKVGELFSIIREPVFRFHRFTSVGECNNYLCLEDVRSDAVDLKVRETSYIDRDLFNLYGIIPPKHKWKAFNNLPYYNHLRIKLSKDSITYKQFTPIFDGIVEIEYYIGKPTLAELSNKEMECINDIILSKNIDVPEPCKISALNVNPILSSYSYTQNEIAYVRYQCLSSMRRDYIEEWNACVGIFKGPSGEFEAKFVPQQEPGPSLLKKFLDSFK